MGGNKLFCNVSNILIARSKLKVFLNISLKYSIFSEFGGS